MNNAQLVLLRILVGAVSGGMASFCSCPIEVCLVRMQVSKLGEWKDYIPAVAMSRVRQDFV